MGYLHIPNLYRPEGQDILLFKKCYALEKIHGTSAHITYKMGSTTTGFSEDKGAFQFSTPPSLTFNSGGEKHDKFVALFDQAALLERFEAAGAPAVTVYGEAYGGKQQGQSWRYGKDLKFVAFDVKIGDCWLAVPQADAFVEALGLEFVHWEEIGTDMAQIDGQRDRGSVQAARNGVTSLDDPRCVPCPNESLHSFCKLHGSYCPYCSDRGKLIPREGVVLRPLIEVTKNNGERVIAKHKRDQERETATPRQVDDPAKLKVLQDAEAIAFEWVTTTRLEHVMDKLQGWNGQDFGKLIGAMVEDVEREGVGEIVVSKDARRAIGARTVKLYKDRLRQAVLD